jgi:hypothetical protein
MDAAMCTAECMERQLVLPGGDAEELEAMDVEVPQTEMAVDVAEGRWAAVPEELLWMVLERVAGQRVRGLGISRDEATVRLVCSGWQASHDALVTRLGLCAASDEAVGMLARRFPAVVAVETRSYLSLTDAGLRVLSHSLPSLTCLNLRFSYKVTDEGARSVSHLRSLTSLHLHSCAKLTDEGLRAVSSLPALTALDLSCCKVSVQGLRAVSSLRSLTSLNLRECSRVTDEGLLAVTALAGLTALDLTGVNQSGSFVTEAGVQALSTAMPQLRIEEGYVFLQVTI